ncbi:MAG: hypothetical protein GY940_08905 [bacterium]|nr:hypothetical protein [bacterium]
MPSDLTSTGETVDEKSGQAHFAVKLLVFLFTLGYLSASMYLVIDCWVNQYQLLRFLLGIPGTTNLPPLFISGIYAILGSILGTGVLDIVSFHKYVAVLKDFKSSHVWGYFFAPLLSSILGLVVFALFQSGLLILAGSGNNSPSEVSNLGFLAIGFLSGFGWYEVIKRIRQLVKRLFSESTDSRSSADRVSITEQMRNDGKKPGPDATPPPDNDPGPGTDAGL